MILNKKEMLSIEVARRKIEKEINELIYKNCIGKTIKDSVDFIFNDKQLDKMQQKSNALTANLLPQIKSDINLSESEWQDFLNIQKLNLLTKVFNSYRVEPHSFNCLHHNLNCDYILTEKDLNTNW